LRFGSGFLVEGYEGGPCWVNVWTDYGFVDEAIPVWDEREMKRHGASRWALFLIKLD